jgi:hypothetical protein
LLSWSFVVSFVFNMILPWKLRLLNSFDVQVCFLMSFHKDIFTKYLTLIIHGKLIWNWCFIVFGTHPRGNIVFSISKDMNFLKLNLVVITCCLTIGLCSLLVEVHDFTFSKHIIANLSELKGCGWYVCKGSALYTTCWLLKICYRSIGCNRC